MGHFFLHKGASETLLLPCRGSIPGTVDNFSVWTGIRWLRALSAGVREFKFAERFWGFEPMNTSQIFLPLKDAGSLEEEQHTIAVLCGSLVWLVLPLS